MECPILQFFGVKIVMSYLIDLLCEVRKKKTSPKSSNWQCPMVLHPYSGDFICGFGSSVVSSLTLYPVNKLIIRQIMEGATLEQSLCKLRIEGPMYLYRGVLPPLLQKAISISTMFGTYNTALIPLRNLEMDKRLKSICASYVSGSLEALFMPFDRIQVLLINSRYHDHFKNTFHTFIEVQKQYGFREYYRGFVIIWFRNTLSNCCFFLLKNELQASPQTYILTEHIKNFCFGGFLGAIMSTLFYPLKVMKVVVHKQLGGPFLSVFQVIPIIYRRGNNGIKNFYTGVVINGIRSLFSWGITNMVYESLRTVVG